MGRSISEPGIFQGVTMEHVRKGGDHQSVVRGWWWGFRVLPGFQQCQREKQTEASLPLGIREGGGHLKMLAGLPGLPLAQRRLEYSCRSTLLPSRLSPWITHKSCCLLFLFLL